MIEKQAAAPMRRVLIPVLVAVALVVGTVLLSGSSLIRIEDILQNRILAGTYGTPDWRVQSMNPLLAQLITGLYRVLPQVNWYGGLLLAMLAASAAALISLASRRRGGLIPAIVLLAPIVVLLTHSVISTAVLALAAAAGAFSVLDGLSRGKAGICRTILGGVLFALGASFSLPLAAVLGAGAVICWLLMPGRAGGLRGGLIGAVVLAIVAGLLFGYSALMYASPELSAYRSNYALYERLQHSSLKAESDRLLEEYGVRVYSEGETAEAETDEHDHSEEEAAAQAAAPQAPQTVFDTVGWSINDASLFFSRFAADTALTDPDTLHALADEASFWNASPRFLLDAFVQTAKKPQFLMLIALLVASALAVLITSRGRGLVVLLACIIAFGGHLVTLARYRDMFADIAPFYLLAIAAMLLAYDGEDALSWLRRVFPAAGLRIALGALAGVVSAAALGGVLLYTSRADVNVNPFTVEAVRFLKPFISKAHEPSMLFIGDNPNERFKPETLAVPQRGEDAYLLAGSYDLYSPRAAALMAEFGIENPLPDSVGRTDIGYVLMGFSEPVSSRLAEAYGMYTFVDTELVSYPAYAEKILQLTSMTEEEVAVMVAEQEALEAEAAEAFNRTIEQLIAEGKVDLVDEHGHAVDAEGNLIDEEGNILQSAEEHALEHAQEDAAAAAAAQTDEPEDTTQGDA